MLSRAKLSLSHGKEGEARLSLGLQDREGTAGAVLTGRGVCKNRVITLEVDPGRLLPDGTQLLGGQVVLVNGAIDERRLFGTWDVSISGPKGPMAARGFLSAGREIPATRAVAAAAN